MVIGHMPENRHSNLSHGRIVAVANQKGGVGKTTTAINVATSLALQGRSVLLVDVDPQGNLTSGVGMKGQRAPGGTTYEALMTERADVDAFILPTRVQHLSLMPADRNLTGAEIEMVPMLARERRLQRVLEPLRARFDFIFIDCPPSLGLLTLNALGALNPSLDIEGVLLTMYDDRTNLGQLVARDVRDFFKDKVFNTIIPRNVRLGEAPSHGTPGVLYDSKSRGLNP